MHHYPRLYCQGSKHTLIPHILHFLFHRRLRDLAVCEALRMATGSHHVISPAVGAMLKCGGNQEHSHIDFALLAHQAARSVQLDGGWHFVF
jgi:hypothetical protein